MAFVNFVRLVRCSRTYDKGHDTHRSLMARHILSVHEPQEGTHIKAEWLTDSQFKGVFDFAVAQVMEVCWDYFNLKIQFQPQRVNAA